MAGAHQITAEILTRTHQITQRLKLRRWHRNRAQLAGRIQSRELERVTRVGLDPVAGLAQDRTRWQTITSKPAALAARANANPVGPASYTARTGPGSACSHSIAAVEDPGSCAFHTSPDPSCTAAAAVFRACTSSPAKQIPSTMSTLPFHRYGNQPAPYDAREHRQSQHKRPA
jgi:hypothetical protein